MINDIFCDNERNSIISWVDCTATSCEKRRTLLFFTWMEYIL